MKRNPLGFLALSLAFAAQAFATPVSDHGRLRIRGNLVVDSAGIPYQLTGMSLFWSTWGGEKFFNAAAIKTTVDWGANVVRIPIAVATPNATPSYLYKPAYKNLVKTAVQAAIDQGIYAIVDWHVEGDSVYEDSARAFFLEMARTYGHTPNVLFEVWNEPTYSSWDSIKAYAERQIAQIRLHSPNLVLVGSPYWSSQPQVQARKPITSDSNVAYAVHFYACSHGNSLRSTVRTAAKSIPIVFTEWGTSAADGSGGVCTDSAQKWIDLARELHIGWANWSLLANPQTSAALIPSAGASGNWSDDQFSASGIWVKAKIQEAAALRGDSARKDSVVVIPLPRDTGVVDTSGPRVVLTSFDLPYGQNPHQSDLALRMGWKDGGWWYVYADDSGTTVTNPAGGDMVGDTGAFSASLQGGTLRARMTTSISKQRYPFAGLETYFLDTSSYFDLRKLTAVALRARGEGSVRVQFLTRDAQSIGDWGTYGGVLVLDTGWKNFVLQASDLVPSDYSALAEAGATWGSSGSASVRGLGFAVGNGEDTRLEIDQITLLGVDSSTFARQTGLRQPMGRIVPVSVETRRGSVQVSWLPTRGGVAQARLVDLAGRLLSHRRVDQIAGAPVSFSLPMPAGGAVVLLVEGSGISHVQKLVSTSAGK